MPILGVVHLVGVLVGFFSLFLLLPLGLALWNSGIYDEETISFFMSFLLGQALSCSCLYWGKPAKAYSIRDGFLTVVLTWLASIVISSLPFYWGGVVPTYLDALFEATSGVTTTGASILPDLDVISYSYILWRSLMQWLGGLAIIVLLGGFMKSLGQPGSNILLVESNSQYKKGIVDRLRGITRYVVGTYIGLSCLGIFVFWGLGMSLFDAVNYSLSLMAGGGFFPNVGGLTAYAHMGTLQYVVLFFMVLAGGNFALYVSLWHRRQLSLIWKSSEIRLFLLLLLLGATCIWLTLVLVGNAPLFASMQASLFMYVSMQSGTGLAITDYTQWPWLAQTFLFVGTFLGGCAGSMSNGFKMNRILVLWRNMLRGLQQGAHPDAITSVRLNHTPVANRSIDRAGQFFFLYILIYIFSALLMTGAGLTIFDALACASGMLGNIGLAFGSYGPNSSFAHLPSFAKIISIFDMFVGRLELFTVLVMFTRFFWKGYFGKSG